MITDPWFYAVAIPAVLIVGISKGGFAGGLGLLGVPMIALMISPLQAAGIMLPILIAMDMIGTWAYRKSFHRENLLILVPGAAIGILIGALTASLVTDAFVRLLVGTIAISFALNHWIGHWTGQHSTRTAQPVNRTKGGFWGAVGGFTSFVAHAGGPPFQVYMLPQKLDKRLYVGTSVMFFTSVNLIKLPPYALLGQLDAGNLATSAMLLPIAPLGILAGIRLLHVIPEKPFYRVAYVLLFLVGGKLTWDGAAAAFF